VLVASAEFTLKSSPVRRTLEQRLVDDLRFALTRSGVGGCRIEKHAARLVAHGFTSTEETRIGAESLSRVFGVAYAAPATLLTASEDSVLQSIVQLAKEHLGPGQSFAIRAHRSEPGHLSRRDVELRGGSQVLSSMRDKGVNVDLDDPNVTFHVDLVGEDAYVYCQKLQGPGGLPLSAQWKMLAVLDSGPLTLLAAYSMMRRGCLVELFIPLSDGNAAFVTENQLELARNLRGFVTRPNYRAYAVRYESLIGDNRKHELGQPGISKRLVRLAAAQFARKKRFKGLIFADVAGEIGLDRALRDAVADVAVFTPLIGLSRGDLTELAKSAGLSGIESVQNVDVRDAEIKVGGESSELPEVQVEQLTL
jgi:thiamine biosynthesis protein ThiI